MSRDFWMWMKQRRKALKLTQKGLADKVGCSQNSIKLWETGTIFPKLDYAERIINVLGGELVLDGHDTATTD